MLFSNKHRFWSNIKSEKYESSLYDVLQYTAISLSNFSISCYCNFAVPSPTSLHVFVRCMLDYAILDMNQNTFQDLKNIETIYFQLV